MHAPCAFGLIVTREAGSTSHCTVRNRIQSRQCSGLPDRSQGVNTPQMCRTPRFAFPDSMVGPELLHPSAPPLVVHGQQGSSPSSAPVRANSPHMARPVSNGLPAPQRSPQHQQLRRSSRGCRAHRKDYARFGCQAPRTKTH